VMESFEVVREKEVVDVGEKAQGERSSKRMRMERQDWKSTVLSSLRARETLVHFHRVIPRPCPVPMN
jgi:hypothetical protein